MVGRNNVFRVFTIILIQITAQCLANDILGCGGFVKSHVNLDFSKIEIGLYSKEGSLKEKTECAPTNGYYFLPLYEKGEYVLKVHPPPGWSFEPSQVELDGETDQCSMGQDVNFSFNGFGITGRVITAGQKEGPSGITVQLVNDKGETRNTATTVGGDFHFTPVIPGKYNLKASHPQWKLEPSQAVVQVKEGNTVLPFGVLAVKGYDVKGSVVSFNSPIPGIFVLLYSKLENPKFRVEGCQTALLQGVPDAPICYSQTNAAGEFTFGLVPAGEYKLVALVKPPGQATVSYNIRQDAVPFSVKHDSLYIKNAFEVTGFNLVGSVLKSANGSPLSGVRVLLDNKAVGTTDASGKYTLSSLQPGQYVISFQHEQSEFPTPTLSISPSGPATLSPVVVSKWRVCGTLSPPSTRLLIVSGSQGVDNVQIDGATGKWCTFLAPGTYNAKVEVAEQEQRDGLQFYPLTQKISVGHGPVSNIAFSQLKAKLTGKVVCKRPQDCQGLAVTLRPLSPDGGYVGKPVTTIAKDGSYTFEDVVPGSLEVSVPTSVLCWQESQHNVAVTQDHTTAPAFQHTGYKATVTLNTDTVQVEYMSQKEEGSFTVSGGSGSVCLSQATKYSLRPVACHRFRPELAFIETGGATVPSVSFTAVSHAAVLRVISPLPVKDLVLKIDADGTGNKDVGPLVPLDQPGGGYAFEHTIYMAEGEVQVITPASSEVVFSPPGPQQVWGAARCQSDALTVRAVPALTLTGHVKPPVEGVLVTLTSDTSDITLTHITKSDGAYKFGPLDASRRYTVTATKESYEFTAPDDKGDIQAKKLAEITVNLVDDADGSPLQGALVSVSGGTYRRNQVSDASGSLRFSALSAAQYYVKPLMKEYKFQPPHVVLPTEEGGHKKVTLRGVRVAWSCRGRVSSLGAAGRAASVQAVPIQPHPAQCATEEATADHTGAFRIRGLLPECKYTLQLKESTAAGLKLVKAPTILEVKDKKDIEDVLLIAIQPPQITDVNVLIHAGNIDHYKTLRLTLTLETSNTPIYSTKLDATGYNQHNNPGVMYVLPRLPADNKTYVLTLESSLGKATHAYEEVAHYFTSDGQFKSFNLEFSPKVKSSEQDLRQSSLLVVPLMALVALAFFQREKLIEKLNNMTIGTKVRVDRDRGDKLDRSQLLHKAQINQIVNSIENTGKGKKKQ